MADVILNPVTPLINDGTGASYPVSNTHPMPTVAAAATGGGITWGAPTGVTLTGSSQNLIAANAARKAIMIINRVGNAQVSYSLSGSAVTLIGGIQLLAGSSDTYTGADCPVGAITIIGTNTQLVTYVEGT